MPHTGLKRWLDFRVTSNRSKMDSRSKADDTNQAQGSGIQQHRQHRLPRSLAPWHTLPFMGHEVTTALHLT